MSNSEALDILQKELECRRNLSYCYSCKVDDCDGCEYEGLDFNVTKAMEVAIEALELCVMIEDDGR